MDIAKCGIELSETMNVKEIRVNPIGFVETKIGLREDEDKNSITTIIIQKDLIEALDGIEAFSHIFVIFWMHQISREKRRITKTHPRGREELPLLGVFATRTPHRPNPIGLTLVELVKREDNVLTVRGLDAFEGTPVLDLKPFDDWDMVLDAVVPEWWTKLDKSR